MKRRCICKHEFSDHAKQEFFDKPPMYYCRICCSDARPPYCIDYREINNLTYLEELSEKDGK